MDGDGNVRFLTQGFAPQAFSGLCGFVTLWSMLIFMLNLTLM